MRTLLPIFIFSLLYAYLTEHTTTGQFGVQKQSAQNKLFYGLLLITLILPVGLRTAYNDTGAYIRSFVSSPTLAGGLSLDKLHILGNPLFEIYTILLRSVTANYHIYLMLPAIFVQCVFISTIRRYSSSFTMGIGLYLCLGSYVFSMAAMKQAIATAVALLAIPQLLNRKYLAYYLLVFVAFLFHTYALAFAVLPFLVKKPWSARTLLLLLLAFLVINNFESVIGSFLDYAEDRGKVIADYEVFDNSQVNFFRLAVYAVVPLMSLVLRRYLFPSPLERQYSLLIHMSIISFAFMLLGTINGANMFGRMGNYFEFGILCSLSWIIEQAFTRSSVRAVKVLAAGCFLFYFYYAYTVAQDFNADYRAVSILAFLRSLISG